MKAIASRKNALKVLSGLLVLGMLWGLFLTVSLHWIVVQLFVTKLAFWAVTIVVVVLLGFLTGRMLETTDSDELYMRPTWIGALVVGFVVIIGVGIIALGAYNQDLASANYSSLVSLLDTSQVRYLPLEVAKNDASNRYQDSQTELDNFVPVLGPDGVNWVVAQTPQGVFNSLFAYNTQGVLTVHNNGTIQTTHASMSISEGMFYNRSVTFQVYQRHPFSDATQPYYVVWNGEVLTLESYLDYSVNFPWLDITPHWGGTLVIHPDGQVEDLSPEQAMSDPRFANQRLVPDELASMVAQAWAYRNGIANAWFMHHDQTQVPELPDTSNQMPYLLPLKLNGTNTPAWVTAFEPDGSKSGGISRVMAMDAHSGKIYLYTVPQGSELLGPNLVQQYIRTALPTINWKTDTGGNVVTLEPRPLIKAGKLYWMVTITSDKFTGVNQTILVDSSSGAMVSLGSLDEVNQFLAGTYAGAPLGNTGPGGNTQDITKMTDDQLWQLIQQMQNELKKRHK